MTKLKLYDQAFYPDPSTSRYHKSKFIEWNRTGGKEKEGEPVFFTDGCLPLATSKLFEKSFKCAILVEPYVISPQNYQFIAKNPEVFNLVFTHHLDIIPQVKNAVYVPSSMCWIDEKDFGLYTKTKGVSFFASDKKWVKGHQFRHEIIETFKRNGQLPFDLFGSGYNRVEHKIEGLKDYRFSIVMENCQAAGYHTEKIIDSFVTSTVPIYYGDPAIGRVYDEKGIIRFKTVEELEYVMGVLEKDGVEIYDKMFPYSRANFAIAKNHLCMEDEIWPILKDRGLV